ncbi:hypothetical protein [Azospirillum sp. Sh1]|uniref:hypothetical protein n=1 Tax=Azospirillum sp. Sh1 TaxID=2607285 RepID=UPI0011F02E40|nr:hypothetical protein [Azospirillum sp. Sh1]KAA0576701.1 hypothetical protein FZ029_12605 [Azospirillum sp. Sh1]
MKPHRLRLTSWLIGILAFLFGSTIAPALDDPDKDTLDDMIRRMRALDARDQSADEMRSRR